MHSCITVSADTRKAKATCTQDQSKPEIYSLDENYLAVRGLTKQCISDLLYVFLPSKSSECVLLFKPCQNFGVVLVGFGWVVYV